jgi:hypothetical protein
MQSLSSVSRDLFAWIDAALSRELPEQTAAFHFNLYEGTDSVHVQLMGTDSFTPGEEPERDYWPGTETFTTGEQIFEIPYEVAGSDWKQWLATCMDLLRSYIATGGRSNVLRSFRGIGVGFVDGDMHVLWQSGVA